MANDARTDRPNANPLGASSVHGQEAENAAGRNSNPPAFLARSASSPRPASRQPL